VWRSALYIASHSGSWKQCSRKRVRQLKKNVKSHVFWILNKNVKNVKNTGRPTQRIVSQAT